MIQPFPLQEFCPAQLWSAAPHDPLPLQSLPPWHLTLAASPPAAGASPARAACAVRKRPATAVAINAPLICLFTTVLLLVRARSTVVRTMRAGPRSSVRVRFELGWLAADRPSASTATASRAQMPDPFSS